MATVEVLHIIQVVLVLCFAKDLVVRVGLDALCELKHRKQFLLGLTVACLRLNQLHFVLFHLSVRNYVTVSLGWSEYFPKSRGFQFRLVWLAAVVGVVAGVVDAQTTGSFAPVLWAVDYGTFLEGCFAGLSVVLALRIFSGARG